VLNGGNPVDFLLGLHAKTYLEKVYSRLNINPGIGSVIYPCCGSFSFDVAHEVPWVVAYYLGHPLSEARFSFLYASVSP